MAGDPVKAPQKGAIAFFVNHPNAANIIMALMLLFGAYGLMNMGTQFFPDTTRPTITISTSWQGASAADVEDGILEAIEPEVRFLDGVEEMESYAREGSATIILTYDDRADMQQAMSDVEQAVNSITILPEDADETRISRSQRYESVGKLLVTGPFSEAALQQYAREIRDELLDRGISKVDFQGLRGEEILIEIPEADLRRLGLSIEEISASTAAQTGNLPSGTLEGGFDRQIRATGEAEEPEGFRFIEVKSLANGEKVYLSDVASIRRVFDEDEAETLVRGNPAIIVNVQRALTADTLESADILDRYLAEEGGSFPQSLKVTKFEASSDMLVERIMLLVNNGISGLILVLIILFIFLNFKVAFWVAMGIPISLMATLGALYLLGESINMMSLFALIMVLGIVVDDAIVVGENIATRLSRGDAPPVAAVRGAGTMFWPVFAASATTIAAFLPLLFIRDTIGQFMAVLPMVVIAVLIASLLECAIVLPAHLRKGVNLKKQSAFRRAFDRGFDWFRERAFGRAVTAAYAFRYTTLALCLAALVIGITAFSTGHLKFSFFPSPESERLTASLTFAPGTSRDVTRDAALKVEEGLEAALSSFGGPDGIIKSAITSVGSSGRNQGDEFAEVEVQLVPSELREVEAEDLAAAWRRTVPTFPGLERLIIMAPRGGGPAGRDIDIRFSGGEVETLKAAALEMTERLEAYPGVSSVNDNLPYGKPELILQISPRGSALGFTIEDVGRQVRNAFEGRVAKTFARGDAEIEVRVRQTGREPGLAGLYSLSLRAPTGEYVPLTEVVSITERNAFAIIQREGGQRKVSVTANVDEDVITSQELTEAMAGPVAEVARKHGVGWEFSGRAEERGKAFADIFIGTIVALGLIYLILAWIFASWFRPLAVMFIIPFGIVGAFLGHYLLGFHITILSMMGLLGLAGILVNDSIILVSQIDERIRAGEAVAEAAVGGAKDRLRAVLLTSLTTLGGLTPLLFETSRQAQFMIPMAITLVFGLGVATLFVLFLVPSIIGIGEDIRGGFARLYGRRGARQPAE